MRGEVMSENKQRKGYIGEATPTVLQPHLDGLDICIALLKIIIS